MKKILITLLAAAIAPAVMAQGSFFYNNFSADGGTGFVLFNGSNAEVETGLQIDIFWGLVGSDVNTFQALGNPVTIGELAAGYFDGGTASIPVVGTPASVLIQYRVITAGYIGASEVVTQPIAYVPNTPMDAVLPANWNITIVPEPSAFALAGLGSAALLIFRRRK